MIAPDAANGRVYIWPPPRRYADGVLPNAARKRALKVDRSPKPQSNAIAVMLSDVALKRAAARLRRVAIRY